MSKSSSTIKIQSLFILLARLVCDSWVVGKGRRNMKGRQAGIHLPGQPAAIIGAAVVHVSAFRGAMSRMANPSSIRV
ncbi:hypothetical protein HMPREF3039_01112 [Akkermansia sp. KLE1798]|nr:hypothetical protein HMPREF3039_01112 [Akkermansia sp. KLE1798]